MQQAASQAPWYAPLVQVTVGAVIALLGVFFTQWQQAKRDRLTDERNLRDAKRKRREEAYRHAIELLSAMGDVMLYFPEPAIERPSEDDLAEAEATHKALRAKSATAHASLALEFGTGSPALIALTEGTKAIGSWTLSLVETVIEKKSGGDKTRTGALEELTRAADQLISVAHEDLARYEQPLPAPRSRPRWWPRKPPNVR